MNCFMAVCFEEILLSSPWRWR